MSETNFLITDQPDEADLAVLEKGLDEFNTKAAGAVDRRPLAVFVTDPATGRVVGGLSGWTSFGQLYVAYFYLPERLRGSGVGSEVVRQAGNEAVRRGCTVGALTTINFQAPEFYRRNGWEAFGEVVSEPGGLSRIYFRKELLMRRRASR